MALSGENSSEVGMFFLLIHYLHLCKLWTPSSPVLSLLKVEIWDLKSAERFARLPSNIGSNSSSVSSKGRGLFLNDLLFNFLPSFF